MSISNPAPGTDTVQVDGFDVPAGTTAFVYRDVFFSPALGEVSVPGTVTTLEPGATTTVSGSVTANGTPAAGRQLFGGDERPQLRGRCPRDRLGGDHGGDAVGRPA